MTENRDAEVVATLRELRGVRAPYHLRERILEGLPEVYAYAPATSPLGGVLVAYGSRGIAAVALLGEGEERFRARVLAERGTLPLREAGLPSAVRADFEARITGRRPQEPVDLRSRSAFQQAVLHAAERIPRGEVRTYGWVAREVGSPGAVRAVGSALARNPVPLAIPCHRVVPADLRLGRYSCGGPEQKRQALLAEGLDVDRLRSFAEGGVRFLGDDRSRVYCTPTCTQARHIPPGHEIAFTTERAARASGYRPCAVCRPALAA